MNDSDLKAALKCMMACGIERLIMARDCQHGPPEDGRQQLADIIQANGCFRTTLWGIDGVEDRMDKTWTCMIIAPQEEIEEKELEEEESEEEDFEEEEFEEEEFEEEEFEEGELEEEKRSALPPQTSS